MSAGRHSPEVLRLKRRIRFLSAELERVAAILLEERQQKFKYYANVPRVQEWIQDLERKPANLAFTDGAERQLAYTIEMLSPPRADAPPSWEDVCRPEELESLRAAALRIEEAANTIKFNQNIVGSFATFLAMRCAKVAQKKELTCASEKSPSK